MLRVLSLVLVLLVAGPPAAPAAVVTETAVVRLGGDKVNVNAATVEQLMTLEGVGRRVAERIVEYRQAHGPFKKADDLRRVPGVGPGLVEKNRERIAVK